MTAPGERDQKTADVFGRAASTYDEVIPFFATFGRRLVELAAVRSGDRVLDLASGRGASAIPAAERAGRDGRVVAVDLAADLCHRLEQDASRMGLTNIQVVIGDVQSFDAADEFDVVLCGFAMHLVEDLDGLLRGSLRALDEAGTFAASIPAGGGEQWGFFGRTIGEFAARASRPLEPPPPERDFRVALIGAGFGDVNEVEESERFVFRDADEWWRWVWSQGMRYALEAFDEPVLSEVKDRMFEEVSRLAGPNGIILDQRVRYFTARK